MRYTVLIFSNPQVEAAFATMTEDERKAAYQVYWDVMNELEASGELVDSKAIDGSGQRLVLVDERGGVEATDAAPPSEADAVTGYYLVEVADVGRAIEIAARFPEARVPGGVRVARNYTEADFAALDG